MKRIKLFLFLAMLTAVTASGMTRPFGELNILCDESFDPTLCPNGVNTGLCTGFCDESSNCSGFSTVHAACVSAGGAFECKCTGFN